MMASLMFLFAAVIITLNKNSLASATIGGYGAGNGHYTHSPHILPGDVSTYVEVSKINVHVHGVAS
jgi:hypothetical protein